MARVGTLEYLRTARGAAPSGDFPAATEEKCRLFASLLEVFSRVGVAYSGGIDSTFTAWFVREKLGKDLTAFFVDSPFVLRKEKEEALRTAQALGLPLEVLRFDPLQSDQVRENPPDRCYFCKKGIFKKILERAREIGCEVVLDGTNAGDSGAYRPGRKALLELGVLSPLAAAGLSKEDVRNLSRLAGIPNWNKPSQSCLATRVPYETALKPEVLRQIESAEEILHSLGIGQVRVRWHSDVARIEVEQADFPKVLLPANATAIVEMLRRLGFTHVCLDLAGFRSGSFDPLPATSGAAEEQILKP